MDIQFASDLHLEFSANKKYLDRHFLKAAGQILLLAGDVIPLAKMEKAKPFLKRLSDMYEHVYWIAGNHEYFYSTIPDNLNPAESFEEKIFSNVTLLNNTTVEMENVEIFFSTFWSHIPDRDIVFMQKGMPDFNLIKDGEGLLSCELYNSWHEKALQYLNNGLHVATNKKRIVVTHHVPTYLQYPKEFADSNITAGFATENKDYIAQSNIDYWIFGHHHRNVDPIYIGKTKLLTNQLGYVWHKENIGFDDQRIISIG
ncbi:MAG: metallophosphoesterase [Pseudopedobacter saltans]|uniref:Metallophosphoesterase n=1 Tax=Pseudopedobacter saltans TaxID=151895 RepID=A0A2W5FDI3_9SPHI|nr:MAG: metallophosphoesterase [Pseudopedobacter saltans]